jgi:hypothetical protein
MEVMVHVTSRDAASVAAPLMRALTRGGAPWGCFFTNDGVRMLRDGDFIDALAGAERAVVCEHSWDMAGGTADDCPIERGSQTINSVMMAEAARLVSL